MEAVGGFFHLITRWLRCSSKANASLIRDVGFYKLKRYRLR